MIRLATREDFPALVDLCREGHGKSPEYSKAPFVKEALLESLRRMVSDANHRVFVAERDGGIVGVLAGTSNSLFYSRKKFACDLFFYVNDQGRGAGLWLAKAYLEWAKTLAGVRPINFGLMSGMPGQERIEAMYEKLGFECIGTIWSYAGEKAA